MYVPKVAYRASPSTCYHGSPWISRRLIENGPSKDRSLSGRHVLPQTEFISPQDVPGPWSAAVGTPGQVPGQRSDRNRDANDAPVLEEKEKNLSRTTYRKPEVRTFDSGLYRWPRGLLDGRP